MILKITSFDPETGKHGWTMYDKVVAVNKYYDKEGNIRINFGSERFPETPADVPVDGVIYVCNDEGKTIDTIYPPIKNVEE